MVVLLQCGYNSDAFTVQTLRWCCYGSDVTVMLSLQDSQHFFFFPVKITLFCWCVEQQLCMPWQVMGPACEYSTAQWGINWRWMSISPVSLCWILLWFYPVRYNKNNTFRDDIIDTPAVGIPKRLCFNSEEEFNGEHPLLHNKLLLKRPFEDVKTRNSLQYICCFFCYQCSLS